MGEIGHIAKIFFCRESRELNIFRSRIFVSGKGVEVELKLPFVSKPNDEVVSEEADQSDEGDQVESLQEKLGTMSFKPRKRAEKVGKGISCDY